MNHVSHQPHKRSRPHVVGLCLLPEIVGSRKLFEWTARLAECELRFTAEQQRSVAAGNLSQMAGAMMCDSAQRDRGDGAARGLQHTTGEVVGGHRPRHAVFVLPFMDECLSQAGDVRDLAPAPEAAQCDEVRSDGAQDAAATRGVEPPIPWSIGCLRSAVTAEVRLQRQLDVAQFADGVRSNQLSCPAPIGFVTEFVVYPRYAVAMLFR